MFDPLTDRLVWLCHTNNVPVRAKVNYLRALDIVLLLVGSCIGRSVGKAFVVDIQHNRLRQLDTNILRNCDLLRMRKNYGSHRANFEETASKYLARVEFYTLMYWGLARSLSTGRFKDMGRTVDRQTSKKALRRAYVGISTFFLKVSSKFARW